MMHMAPSAGGLAMGGFFLLWLLMTGGMIVGWIILLVAIWKGMRAHESIAASLKQIAQKQQPAGL